MKTFLTVILLGIVATGVTVFIVEQRKATIQGDEVKRVVDSVHLTRKLDSLRSVLETRFRDSLKVQVKPLLENIRVLQSDLKKLRNENTIRQERYDSISVSMPEF